MRKCSAVVCKPGPIPLPAGLLSSVLPSVLLLMVALLFRFYVLPDEPVLCMTPLSRHSCAKPACSTGTRSSWPLGARSAKGHDYLSQFSDLQDNGRSSAVAGSTVLHARSATRKPHSIRCG